MRREPLIMACCSDIAGQVRGKAFAARDFDQRSAAGIGWCPTNIQITAFDQIADSPFGALGDLLLRPDPGTRIDVEMIYDNSAARGAKREFNPEIGVKFGPRTQDEMMLGFLSFAEVDNAPVGVGQQQH